MAEIVYLNGRLLPREEARISPFDHGFLYGYGLFETVRAYPSPGSGAPGKGRLFRLDRHLRRLRESARILGIEGLPPEAKLSQAAHTVIEANSLAEARLRISVSLGPGEITPDPPANGEPTVFVAARPFSPPASQVYDAGYSAVIFPERVGGTPTLAQHKTTNYLLYVLARRHARAEGAQEALLVNTDGQLLEASTANLFLVAEGQVMTAPVSEGVLAGITREAVLELSGALGIKASEVALPVEALQMVEEAFLTSSLLGIMPLTRVAGQPIGHGKPGSVTLQLMRTYDLLVKRETGAL
ncbi:MAG: aminotransferase class IV [Chloroflexi bacterium]|nr:aminotransferase class IV [Chloroflexota bacterium]